MRLFLVRHGQTEANLRGVFCGLTDLALTPQGVEQAGWVAGWLADVDFSQGVSSQLLRARHTADIILAGHRVSADSDGQLNEMNFGDWEMQKWDKIQDENLQKWYDDWLNVPTTNGESFHDMYARFSTFAAELPPIAETVAVFTHGGIINCARIYAGQITADKMFEEMPAYGSVTELDILPGLDHSKE